MTSSLRSLNASTVLIGSLFLGVISKGPSNRRAGAGNFLCSLEQVFCHEVWLPRRGPNPLCFVPVVDKNGPAACCVPRLHIVQNVTNHPGCAQVKVVLQR